MTWSVLAPTTELHTHALAGKYVGATADVSSGLGGGAKVLVGGRTERCCATALGRGPSWRQLSISSCPPHPEAGTDPAAVVAHLEKELAARPVWSLTPLRDDIAHTTWTLCR
jgi:hypothetical protein